MRFASFAIVAVAAFSLGALPSCAVATDGEDADALESEPTASGESSALSSDYQCTGEMQDAYSGGTKIGRIEMMMVGGKRMSIKTGNAFLDLQKRAAAKGFDISINSGFRTMAEQTYFYHCYTSGSCNSGNLAARPGYSNHQSGRAVDIGGNRTKLDSMLRGLGWMGTEWRKTVASEDWHYEYFGPDVDGPCGGTSTGSSSGGASGGTDADAGTDTTTGGGAGCHSATLGKNVVALTCVQARSDSKWYQCVNGSWENGGDTGTGPGGECDSTHPL